MRVIRDFDTNRDTVISDMESKGFTLIEEQYHFDGKHLIFENDVPEPELWIIATEVKNIKARLVKLEKE